MCWSPWSCGITFWPFAFQGSVHWVEMIIQDIQNECRLSSVSAIQWSRLVPRHRAELSRRSPKLSTVSNFRFRMLPTMCEERCCKGHISLPRISISPEFDANADTVKVPFTEKQIECKRTSPSRKSFSEGLCSRVFSRNGTDCEYTKMQIGKPMNPKFWNLCVHTHNINICKYVHMRLVKISLTVVLDSFTIMAHIACSQHLRGVAHCVAAYGVLHGPDLQQIHLSVQCPYWYKYGHNPNQPESSFDPMSIDSYIINSQPFNSSSATSVRSRLLLLPNGNLWHDCCTGRCFEPMSKCVAQKMRVRSSQLDLHMRPRAFRSNISFTLQLNSAWVGTKTWKKTLGRLQKPVSEGGALAFHQ